MRHALGDLATRAQHECGGRAVPDDKVHVTLFFLGNVEHTRISALEDVAQHVTAAPFELEIDGIDYWRHNRIVWAGVSAVPAALAALARDLSAALGSIGFMAEERPYVPHVTLVRNAKRAPKRVVFDPIHWRIRDWALVESVAAQGRSAYQVISSRPLAV